ncbi:MAG: hypothetical protein H6677_27405 [Candidatus Obscuribacterales bacterium]|nr:hypothetical protein [Candidatus Obscuribacterales bacterium]
MSAGLVRQAFEARRLREISVGIVGGASSLSAMWIFVMDIHWDFQELVAMEISCFQKFFDRF